MADENELKVYDGATICSRRHPRYAEYSPSWDFFLSSYLGGPVYLNNHLFRYVKEGDKEFRARQERAFRENHTKRVVDLITSYLFKEEAERKSDSSMVAKFWKDFDGRGYPAVRFMKRASLFSSVLGRVYIAVDKRPLAEEEVTGTQADNLKSMPYCYMIYPQDMLDIAFDHMGKIVWAVVREWKRYDDEDPLTVQDVIEPQYRFWTRNEWVLFDKDMVAIDGGEHGLGRVPLVMLDNEEGDDYTGQSLITDIAYLDRAVFNNWSRLDVIVNDQTFSQLIFPVEGLPVDVVENKELRDKFLTLAQNRVLLYSAQATAKPEFISPDASQATFILGMIQTQVKQLYASIGLQSETSTETTTQSGVAKAYDFDKLNKLLATKADNCEHAENEILDIFRRWMGGISAAANVEYPDEFDTRSLADEITLAQELTLMDISPTFTRELHKGVAAKVMPKADPKTIATINEEIDSKAEPADEAAKEPVFPFDDNSGLKAV